ncbi:MAG: phosphorylase [Scytolyngbya sp. HA4215-MV1]|jgi:hypothetical protein|nr:phosphorylase [Scytolyngbya sp. HA4215-MV1]
MSLSTQIHAILVPQGAEYQAVSRGLGVLMTPTPPVLTIPIGAMPLIQRLKQLQQMGELSSQTRRVLLLGLCGSLDARYRVGDGVVYAGCMDGTGTIAHWQGCDPELTTRMGVLTGLPETVKAVTSDRVIATVAEKHLLAQTYGAAVVDMEGFAALAWLHQAGITAAVVRVVSDDCHHDIPDLSSAITAEGALKPLPLAIALLQNPIAAVRLIRGSLKGLQALQAITTRLFADVPPVPHTAPTP